LKSQGINQLIVLGDYIAKGPNPAEVTERIRSLKTLATIQGNTEIWAVVDISNEVTEDFNKQVILDWVAYAESQLNESDKAYLTSLPEQATIEIEGFQILCVHGSPRSNRECVLPNMSEDDLLDILSRIDADILLVGHTHIGFEMMFSGCLICNPGSVGASSDEKEASYGILEIDGDYKKFRVYQIDYDYEELIKQAKVKGFPHQDIYLKMVNLID
jgi:putative phosphoesterase